MKKFLFIFFFIISITNLFAQYTVTNIIGRCEQEVRPNEWKPIKIGDVLQDESVIKTWPESWLTLDRIIQDRHIIFIISPMNIGMIIDIFHLNKNVNNQIRTVSTNFIVDLELRNRRKNGTI